MGATWQIEGTVVLACNCDYGCPCNFNARPTYGHCEGAWTWHVERGRFGGVSLDGLNFSLIGDWPGALHDRGGEAVSLVDERADAAQRDALTELLSGRVGKPWEILATTFDVMRGPYPVPYALELAGHHTALRAGDAMELELEPIRNPVTGAEAHPGLVLPEGMIVHQASVTTSKTFRVSKDVHYDHSGQYGAFGPFSYSG